MSGADDEGVACMSGAVDEGWACVAGRSVSGCSGVAGPVTVADGADSFGLTKKTIAEVPSRDKHHKICL